MGAYMEHLKRFPQYKEPGIMANIAAALGGASAGYRQGAGEGLAVSEGYRQLPYQRELQRWQAQAHPLEQAAALEERDAQMKALNAYRTAMEQRREEQPITLEKMKEQAKKEAQEAKDK